MTKNKVQEKIFKEILKQAKNAGDEAIKNIKPGNCMGWGKIVVYDARKRFTRWLLDNDYAYYGEYPNGAHISSKGGQYYYINDVYASAFCEVLQKFGIKCKNNIKID